MNPKPNPFPEEIALVDQFDKLKPGSSFGTAPEIKVTIAVLEPEKSTPRNFNRSYDHPKTSVGGCFARIYASEYGDGINANIFSQYGPDISYGDFADYKHALNALKRIDAALERMRAKHGYAVDAADHMARWLEACNIKHVWLRPESVPVRSGSWLNEGEWETINPGAFISRLRTKLYIAPPKQEPAPAQAVA